MSDIKCLNCGWTIEEGSSFCRFCGYEIHKAGIEEKKTQIYSDKPHEEEKTQSYSDEGKTKVYNKSSAPNSNNGKIFGGIFGVLIIVAIVALVIFSNSPGTGTYDIEKQTSPTTEKVADVVSPTNYYNEGIILYNQGKYDEAIVKFDKVLEIDPNFLEAWRNKGLCYQYKANPEMNLPSEENSWENGQVNMIFLDLSISSYQKAIEIDSGNEQVKRNLAVVLTIKGAASYEKGNNSEAIKSCDKAIAIDPYYAPPWYFKGNVYYGQRGYRAAIDCYDKAITIDPNYAYAWYNKGLALHILRNYSESEKCFQKSKALGYKG